MTDNDELPWTGERLVPSLQGDTAIEHLHRYAFAREYVRERNVLDIACGEGYGSNLLAEVAAHVVGVDIAEQVIGHARRKYGKNGRLSFRAGSCTAIPLEDASVDVVVSFETLEHVDEQEQMLREVKRILRPDGVLIISTPDKLHYSVLPNYHNPYHVRECFKHEFQELLSRFFARVSLFEQKICHASLIAPSTGSQISSFRYYQGDFERLTQADGIVAPMFNLAVATDSASEPGHNVSVFQGLGIPTEVELQLAGVTCNAEEVQEQLRRELDTVQRRRAELDERVAIIEQQRARLDRQVEELLNQVRQQSDELEFVRQQRENMMQDQDALRAHAVAIQADLHKITHSRSWTLIRRLARIKEALTRPF